jgi:energy-coupling factor transport system ATP-binding protein
MTAEPEPPVVELTGFTFRHAVADEPALTGISLSIRRGEYVAVLGAAGAGVSTVLRALDGVVPQLVAGVTGGTIRVAGLDPLLMPVRRMAPHVGLVLDDPEVATAQATVDEEVAFGLENLAVPRAEMGPRIGAALAEVGLAGFGARAPLTLSGGERQRLAIASVLVMGTEILVLDEPTSNLDPAGRRAVFALLRRLNRERGVTVVAADRDVEALAGDATRVVVLDRGRVVADGDPSTVLGDPAAMAAHGVRVPQVAEMAARIGVPAPVPVSVDGAVRRTRVVAPAGARDGEAGAATRRAAGAVPGAPPVIAIRDVVFRYPGAPRPAVDGVSLLVAPGEVVGIAGANGGGKTTLGRLLNGLERPQRGRVVVDGLDTASHPVRALAAHVGSVFQDSSHQLFATTVADELAMGPRAIGLAEAEVDTRVRGVVDALELGSLLGDHPFRLPRAMRKLVALGAVLTMRPPVLVLDEPTTGHDAQLAGLVAERIAAAAGEGTAVVVLCHDMAFLARVADRIVVMAAGTVLGEGTPREVFTDPSLLEAAGLEAPQVTQLALALAPAGPDPWPPVTVEEAVLALRPAGGSA